MYHYAHVLDGIVVTISTWAAEPTDEDRARYAPEVLVDATGPICGPQWSYANGVFTPPPQPILYYYAATQYGWVFGTVVLDHEATDFERAQALPRTLVACSPEVQIGWRYNEATGVFGPP